MLIQNVFNGMEAHSMPANAKLLKKFSKFSKFALELKNNE